MNILLTNGAYLRIEPTQQTISPEDMNLVSPPMSSDLSSSAQEIYDLLFALCTGSFPSTQVITASIGKLFMSASIAGCPTTAGNSEIVRKYNGFDASLQQLQSFRSDSKDIRFPYK